jgi:alginate O-acetyltransferase complex protein AlgI
MPSVIWMAVALFSIQIYCDFPGYSDIAIGIARILGFRLPLNFDRPYFASNPSEFWRRWHISLSSWLRDYLYISLGGNRRGRGWLYFNLMATMLLGGLWHGASWNFVLWGFLHGVALIVHRIYSAIRSRRAAAATALPSWLRKAAAITLMQYWVLLTWIAFRVRDKHDMLVVFRKFLLFDFDFSMQDLGLGGMSVFSNLAIALVFLVTHACSARWGGLDERMGRWPLPAAAAAGAVIGIVFTLLWPLKETAFIYFQF